MPSWDRSLRVSKLVSTVSTGVGDGVGSGVGERRGVGDGAGSGPLNGPGASGGPRRVVSGRMARVDLGQRGPPGARGPIASE